jgi:glycosyltransferase involved in cell wall biosynthesis
MRPIRVLFLTAGFAVEGPLGGIERFTTTLAQAFDRRAVQPIVCGLWDFDTPYDQAWVRLLRRRGIEAFIAAPWRERSPLIALLAACRAIPAHVRHAVDIIHSQSEFGDPIALLLRSKLQARALVRSVHEEVEWRKRPWRRILFTNLCYPLGFDCEIGISTQIGLELDRRPLARLLGRQAPVFTNAIDVERVERRSQCDQALKRRELGVPNDAVLVCSIGRLAPQKGYAVLLQAAAEVLRHNPHVHFLVAGEGALRTELEALRQHLGIEAHMRFLGARSDVEQILAAADLFVHPSLWEGLPTAIMESMVVGIPVVATALAGSRQLVGANERGMLTTPGDAAALAASILQAVAMPRSVWATITEHAKSFVIANYSIQAVAARHTQLYHRLLNRPLPPAEN